MTTGSSRPATAAGLISVLLWGSTFGISRSVFGKLGMLNGMAGTYLICGLISVAVLVARGRLGSLRSMPRAHLVSCGGLFLLYAVSINLGIGLSVSHRQMIEVSLINYLWPGLTLVLSVPILRRRARPLLALGLACGLAGVFLALVPADAGPAEFAAGLGRNLVSHPVPYLCGLTAALSWALYSNLNRQLAGDGDLAGAMPLYFLLTGIFFLAGALLFSGRVPVMDSTVALELGYIAVFPYLLAYSFWDLATRRGNQALVVAVSYFTPLLSTAVSCVYLGQSMGPRLVVACVLIAAGAVISKLSVVER